MRLFTVKDFIAYNNPCFSCGNAINFRIIVFDIAYIDDFHYPSTAITQIRPTVTPECTEIDLRITFNDALKLCVFHKTNKIFTNNKDGLIKYMQEHMLHLSSTCDSCCTHIDSSPLVFDLDKNILKAVQINFERLLVDDNEHHYQINSFYATGRSDVVVDKTNTTGTLTPIILDLPLIPKSSFKNKRHFLKKIKTYILFS